MTRDSFTTRSTASNTEAPNNTISNPRNQTDALDFDTLSVYLLKTANLTMPPGKPKNTSLTAKISSLNLHPTLEAALHILNSDLPSAHFLVRHMQAPPALEGMLLHSILHRCEGDFRNARLWLNDVGDACAGFKPKKKKEGVKLDRKVAEESGCEGVETDLLGWIYGGEKGKGREALIKDVEELRKRKSGEEEKRELNERIRTEMTNVLEWCIKKFGTKEWTDASSAWVKNSEEVQKISNDMVSGNKGYRKF